jgi:hypothetical protein
MQKVIFSFILCFILTSSFGQTQKIISTYLYTQFNTTVYEVTKGNNPWGIGLGVQTFLNNHTKFKPTIELTGDIYLVDDKVFRTDSTGTPLNDVRGMVNLFVGTSFNPTKNMYLSVVVGPSFINGQTLFGIKPSLGFYFPKSQRWTGKISYINIFNRGNTTKKDFGSISLAIGIKLF